MSASLAVGWDLTLGTCFAQACKAETKTPGDKFKSVMQPFLRRYTPVRVRTSPACGPKLQRTLPCYSHEGLLRMLV